MSRVLLVITLCISSFILTECRMGWKNNGGEFLVYSANTTFNSTNSLSITGKFSITPGTTVKSPLLAVDDFNGTLSCEVYVNGQGRISTVVRQGSAYQPSSFSVTGIRSGYVFDFTVTVTQSELNGTYSHVVSTEISGSPSFTVVTKDSIKWDLHKMKLFVGGYSNPGASIGATYFHGCLSNVIFQGVDIIAAYFSQYPNNTNPVRGSLGSPPYATALQNCGDVMSTVGPTASTAKITTTKKPGAAASYKASVFILVVAFLLTLLSF